MQASFKATEFHTVQATFGGLVSTKLTDSRVPDEMFEKQLSLESYNKLVDFIRENDHRYAITMAKRMFH